MAVILVVDDSMSMRRLVASIANSLSHVVIEMPNGVDTLAYLANHTVDLIFADYHMPLMNGIDMVREIRHIPACAKTPIVMITVESNADLKQLSKEAGVNGWLIKPFKEEKLLDVITKYFPFSIS